MDVLQRLQVNALPPIEAMLGFGLFLHQWDERGDLYIVSDNPGFDFGMINYYMDISGQHSLNYKVMPDGSLQYRSNHDADSYGRGKAHQDAYNPWYSTRDHCPQVNPDLHGHMPEDDAEYIYRTHFNIQRNVA